MGKLPAILFYPGDWLLDSVSGCSLQAQGLWLRMMIEMHSSERRGYLVMNGRPMPDDYIARKCGCDVETYRSLLAELTDAKVPRKTSDGILFNKRMVRDERERQQNRDRVAKSRNGVSNACVMVESRSLSEDVKESESKVETILPVVPMKFELEEFDGSELFEKLCRYYKKAERSPLASSRFMEAVEWLVSHRQMKRLDAANHIIARAKVYCDKCKFQKGLTKWLEEKIFEQDESVWSDSQSNTGKQKTDLDKLYSEHNRADAFSAKG